MVYVNSKPGEMVARALSRFAMAALAAVTFGFAASSVGAQQKPEQPAGTAKAPAAPKNTGPQQGSWVKLCEQARKSASSQDTVKVCMTLQERIDANTGRIAISAAIRKIDGAKKDNLMVMLPLGIALHPGVRVQVDKEKPFQLKFTNCTMFGCTAETFIEPDTIGKLKSGNKMRVGFFNMQGQLLGFDLSLVGFTKAHDGAPVDSKTFADAKRRVLEQIRQRQMKLREKAKKAEGAGAAGQPGAAPAKPQ